MLVQPTPIGPRSRGSRLRLIALVAAVPVILVGVVAAGLAGRSDGAADPSSGTSARAESTAATGGQPAASGPSTSARSQPATTSTGLRAIVEGVTFPGSALGIPVWDVRHAMAAHRQGAANGLVSIRGWLTVAPTPVSCIRPRTPPEVIVVSHARFFCRREAVLAGSPDRNAAGQVGSSLATTGLAVPQWVMPGTALPMSVEPPFANDHRRQVPVVVLGRFDDDRVVYCPAGGYGCDEGFVIEQVAWMSGRWQESRAALEPGIAPREDVLASLEWRAAAVAALPGGGPLLSEALMSPRSVSGAEPAAAPAAAGAEGPVWLIRAVVHSARGSFGRDVGWLVMEASTGRILGSSDWAATASR